MLRAVLGILLVAFVGVTGYYIGRQSASAPVSDLESSRSRAGRLSAGTVPDAGDVSTPPAANVTTPPAIEPGSGAGPAPVPQTPSATAPTVLSTGPVNEGVAPESSPADPGTLADRNLGLPVAHMTEKDIRDTFDQSRGGGERRHEASDIMAPKGTPVLAVESGVIQKLFTSKPGGLTIYQFDPTEKYVYYYAHLDRYAEGIREGMVVNKGDVIGYVGSTGNADPNAPHLHFGIFELGPERKWYSNLRPVNPYPLLLRSAQQQNSRSSRR